MARWLMKFELESDFGVERGTPRLIFKHPRDLYEVHLENHHMEPGCEAPLLHAYVLFFSEDSLDSAEKTGEKHFKQFVNFLTFAGGVRFRIKRRLCLFDWTAGIAERDGYMYGNFPDPNLPQLIMNDNLVSAVEALLRSDDEQELTQALHWFAAAVSADPSDEQFELFWFSIETLARLLRDKTKVPDLCPRCREPLYCTSCQTTPTHRPYPAQAVRQLFERHVSDQPDRAYRAAAAMRHSLLHGERISRSEGEEGVTLSQLVDWVGKVGRAALLTALGNRAAQRGGDVRFQLLYPNTFLHQRIVIKSRFSFTSPAGREPVFDDIPKVDMDLIVREQAEPSEGNISS
jgi:hypothetical protein